jgi:DNA-binding transcriptional regulator LsrR (DeoR family)
MASEELRMRAMAAAKLRSDGALQIRIADALGVSQPEVSRLLKLAEAEGWLDYPSPTFKPDEELLKIVEERYFSGRDVYDKLIVLDEHRFLRKVRVIQTQDELFQPSIAKVVGELISNANAVGVTWGRTIGRLVEALTKYLDRTATLSSPIRFVPLCGEPLKDRLNPTQYSSTSLAFRLGQLFNGSDELRPPSLAGVPAFVPHDFNANETSVIRKFIHQVAGYSDVFGDNVDESSPGTGLADQVQVILTSVGVVDDPRRGIFLKERVELGDISSEELEEYVIGDLGGLMITRKAPTKSQQEKIDKKIRLLNLRSLGIQERHFRACARSSLTSMTSGVVVIAMGAKRIGMVKRCVQLGLVNELIVDQELAGCFRN